MDNAILVKLNESKIKIIQCENEFGKISAGISSGGSLDLVNELNELKNTSDKLCAEMFSLLDSISESEYTDYFEYVLGEPLDSVLNKHGITQCE